MQINFLKAEKMIFIIDQNEFSIKRRFAAYDDKMGFFYEKTFNCINKAGKLINLPAKRKLLTLEARLWTKTTRSNFDKTLLS